MLCFKLERKKVSRVKEYEDSNAVATLVSQFAGYAATQEPKMPPIRPSPP